MRNALVIVMIVTASSCAAHLDLGGGNVATKTAGVPAPNNIAPATGPHVLVTAPSVAHRSRADAEAAFRAAGIRGEIRVDVRDPSKPGEVCNQSPSEGQQTYSDYPADLTICPLDGPGDTRPVLEGLSVADATKRARAAGFSGAIEVHKLDEYDGGCKADTVCRITPYRWELDQVRTMELWVNKTASVVMPN